jgi:hypothetical protein
MTHRKSEKAAETDAKVDAAMKGLSTGLYKTLYAAATAFRLNRAMLSRRLAGGNSHVERKENQQNLTYAEEKTLARWITELMATGHPVRHPFIRNIVKEIRKHRYSSSTTPIFYPVLCDSWVPQFLNRHPTLHTTISRLIESAQIKDVSYASIINFFEVFCSILEDNQIILENVYNMDKTGLLTYCLTDNRIWNPRKSS